MKLCMARRYSFSSTVHLHEKLLYSTHMIKNKSLTSILLVFVLLAAQAGEVFAGVSLLLSPSSQAPCSMAEHANEATPPLHSLVNTHSAQSVVEETSMGHTVMNSAAMHNTSIQNTSMQNTSMQNTSMHNASMLSSSTDCCDMPNASTCCVDECQCVAFVGSLVFLNTSLLVITTPIIEAPSVNHKAGASAAHSTLPKRPPIRPFS